MLGWDGFYEGVGPGILGASLSAKGTRGSCGCGQHK